MGSFVSGYIMEKIGRRNTLMIVTAGTFFASYILIIFAVDVTMVYVGRYVKTYLQKICN